MIETVIVMCVFLFMEFVAWFSHKYVMHGFLWVLHRDHHVPSGHKLQRNDLFSLIFAIPSVVLCIWGARVGFDYRFWAGIGIALYGMTYFLLHDTLVHQRVRIPALIDNFYFRAVVSAHSDHHTGKKNFGFMFMFPRKYFRKEHQDSRRLTYFSRSAE